MLVVAASLVVTQCSAMDSAQFLDIFNQPAAPAEAPAVVGVAHDDLLALAQNFDDSRGADGGGEENDSFLPELPVAMEPEVAAAHQVNLLAPSLRQPEVQPQAENPKKGWFRKSIVGKTGAAVFRGVLRSPKALGWLAKTTASALGRAAQATGKCFWNVWWGRPAQLPAYEYWSNFNVSSLIPANMSEVRKNQKSKERTERLKQALVFTSQEKARAIRNVILRTTLNTCACAAIGGAVAYGAGCNTPDIAGWSTAMGTAGGILASAYSYYRSKIDVIYERCSGVVALAMQDGIQAHEVKKAHTQAQQEVGWWSRFGMKHTVNALIDLRQQKSPEPVGDYMFPEAPSSPSVHVHDV